MHMPILVEFGWVGNSPQISEIYPLCDFVVSLFSRARLEKKTREQIWTISGLKRMKSRKDVSFKWFREKISPPPPLAPKFCKFGITKAVFRSKHV